MQSEIRSRKIHIFQSNEGLRNNLSLFSFSLFLLISSFFFVFCHVIFNGKSILDSLSIYIFRVILREDSFYISVLKNPILYRVLL